MRINMLLNMETERDDVHKTVEACLCKNGIRLLNVQTTCLDTGARFMLFTTSVYHKNELKGVLEELRLVLKGKIAEMRVF